MALPKFLSERELAKFTQGPSGEVIVNTNILGSGKGYTTVALGLSATNLSGSTAIVASTGKKFYITHLTISNASLVGVAFMSGVTYLLGNPSIRIPLVANSNFKDDGSPEAPIFFGLENATDFRIVADTAAPIAGKIIYYEE